jgi:predicted nucleotidyltransferase
MDKDTAITIIREHAGELRRLGATAIYLYGSTARGEETSGSDVDLFIDYDKNGRFSLVDLVRLEHFLERLLKTETDVLTRGSLHPMLKDKIIGESIRVF